MTVKMLVCYWFLLVFLVGCQATTQQTVKAPDTQAPTIEPTTAMVTAPPTDTSIPPTSTPESPTPTVELPTPTKKPLPQVSLDTLLGIWTQYDNEAGGYNWLIYNDDGTYRARHGPSHETGLVVADGSFVLEGDLLTLIEPNECPGGETYKLRYINQTEMRYELVESTCNFLAEGFEKEPLWKQVPPEG
jgi:hypothetical protein